MIKINSHELGRVLKALVLTAGKNDIRYYLNGVLFEYKGHELTLVATDGHRCAIAKIKIENDDNVSASFILAIEDVKAIRTVLLKKENLNVEVEITVGDDELINFKIGYNNISFKPINGTFPQYERVIPNLDAKSPDTMGIDPAYLKDMGEQFKILKALSPAFRMTEQTVHMALRVSIGSLISFQSFVMQTRI